MKLFVNKSHIGSYHEHSKKIAKENNLQVMTLKINKALARKDMYNESPDQKEHHRDENANANCNNP